MSYSKILCKRRRTIKESGSFKEWLIGSHSRTFRTEPNWLNGATIFLHETSHFGMEYIEASNPNGMAYVSLYDCPFKLGDYNKKEQSNG